MIVFTHVLFQISALYFTCTPATPALQQGQGQGQGQGQDFSLHSVQTGSGDHPISYPIGTEGKAAEV
jgi:hypothetical protein